MKIIVTGILILVGAAGFAQPASEIYLFDLKIKKGEVTIANPVNITNHKGYDNQPSFDGENSFVYYSSFNDEGRADIKVYDYKKKTTKSFTTTQEREYSPTLTPDKEFISCIIQRDNNAQDLGKYPLGGGAPDIIIDNMIVGYHAWMDNSHLAMFVLGEPNSLHFYQLPTRQDTVLANNIGRSLHKIPGERAFSFVHKVSDKDWLIKKVDLGTMKISTITSTQPGHEDIAWVGDMLLTSDGEKIFVMKPGKEAAWREVTIKSGKEILKGVTRLAVSQKGDKLAVVVAE